MIEARIKGHNWWITCRHKDPADAAIYAANFATDDNVTVEVMRVGATQIKVYEVKKQTKYTVTELPSIPA